jgi:regulator of replication initiation timing
MEGVVLMIPESFEQALKDIKENRVVDLDKALTTNYDLSLENNKLKERIKFLELKLRVLELTECIMKTRKKEESGDSSEKVQNICKQIEEIYRENSYLKMHNHVLGTANDELARANKIMEETLINIWECFEIRSEIYHNDWVGLQALANKARICLEEIGYEWRKDK